MTLLDDDDVDGLSVPDPSTGEIKGQRCVAFKADGTQCLAHAIQGEDRCVYHSQSEYGLKWREAGQAAGGRKPVLRNLDGMPASIKDAPSILAALDRLYGEAIKGDATPTNAASILKILGQTLRAIELVDIDARLRAIEEKD